MDETSCPTKREGFTESMSEEEIQKNSRSTHSYTYTESGNYTVRPFQIPEKSDGQLEEPNTGCLAFDWSSLHDAKGCNDGSTEWAVDDLGRRYAELLEDVYELSKLSHLPLDQLSNVVGLAGASRLRHRRRDDYGDVIEVVDGLVRTLYW